jgi:hypothetical protein
MALYHVTTTEGAAGIEANGFSDAAGYYRQEADRAGVWIADTPQPVGTGIASPVVFEIDAPVSALAEYEWSEAGKTFRQWLVPASVLNAYPRRRVGA